MKTPKLYWNLGQTFLRMERLPIFAILPAHEVVNAVFSQGNRLKIPVLTHLLNECKQVIKKKSNANCSGDLFLSIGSNARGNIGYFGVKEHTINIHDHLAIAHKLGQPEANVYNPSGNPIKEKTTYRFIKLESAVDTTETSNIVLHKREIKFKNPLLNLIRPIAKKYKFKFRKRYYQVSCQTTFKYKEYVPVKINEGLIIAVKIIDSKIHREKIIEK